jgi:hypothetical protein
LFVRAHPFSNFFVNIVRPINWKICAFSTRAPRAIFAEIRGLVLPNPRGSLLRLTHTPR